MQLLKDFKNVFLGIGIVIAGLWIYYVSTPGHESYQIKVVVPSAENLAVGAPVWINGFDAGKVSAIDVKDGKAVVTAGVVSAHAPLHAGTTSRVQWYAALGERALTLHPGPETNPEIPDGGMIEGESKQVEVDQVLAALDSGTRQKLNGLIASVHQVSGGHEKDIQATLQSAGPTVQAAGAIFDAVGRDGPAIRQLITELHEMIEVTARQQGDIRGTISSLDTFTSQVATQQQQLSDTIKELPPFLRSANETLKVIPPSADAASEMLRDLRGATRRLPGVAEDLRPIMKDMRPAIDDLRPSLGYLRDALNTTPDLLDGTHEAFPQLRDFLHGYQPAVSFLRGYVPEFVGWFQNWGMNFSSYDSQGHLWAAVLGEGSPQAFNESPAAPPPILQAGEPKPGEVIGQPWSDPDASGEPGR